MDEIFPVVHKPVRRVVLGNGQMVSRRRGPLLDARVIVSGKLGVVPIVDGEHTGALLVEELFLGIIGLSRQCVIGDAHLQLGEVQALSIGVLHPGRLEQLDLFDTSSGPSQAQKWQSDMADFYFATERINEENYDKVKNAGYVTDKYLRLVNTEFVNKN